MIKKIPLAWCHSFARFGLWGGETNKNVCWDKAKKKLEIVKVNEKNTPSPPIPVCRLIETPLYATSFALL